ncbi:polysaccharide deacetylase family protein [Mycolicibacterium iranicum]|uniref:Polysaccharide deacetylase n=1 Tax=Mycolicibacterium iranicum TaxID=912594 RepID=A0A178M122_MYCIR|nr:polysaccharide deacetylase family protein [Mycolicibacterium iranicum]OAN41584.1 polysaccharide deacetylase [Mycolicibacterium iranicum]
MTEGFRRAQWRSARRRTPKSLVVGLLLAFVVTAPVAEADAVDCARVKCVALTFDDGPGPYTDRLLQILGAHGAQATFFLIGDRVAADPAAARRIAAAGMEIGNHTWQHLDMTTLPPQDVAVQFSRATDALVAATGQRPVLARTGFGAIDDAVLAEAGRQGLAVINWDVNTLDYKNDFAATRDLLRTQVRPNSVVLLHDTLAPTVDLMAGLVPELTADGYHLVTVSQMLGPRPPGSLYGSRERA